MKILIIDDDIEIANYIKNSLINNSHNVDLAIDGTKGSYMARTNNYDIIIIDYSLPDKNGITVCTEIRSSGSLASIIFISINQTLQNKVACLEAGGDDYITKPFALEELHARIKALNRRPRKIESNILIINDLELDTRRQTVKKGGEYIYLTRTEYNIFEYLFKNKGMIISRGMIMEHVWNAESDPFTNTVETHMANIRRKLNLKNKNELIRNIPGRGYMLES